MFTFISNEPILGIVSAVISGVVLYKIVTLGIQKISTTNQTDESKSSSIRDTISTDNNLRAAFNLSAIIEIGLTIPSTEHREYTEIKINKDTIHHQIEKYGWEALTKIIISSLIEMKNHNKFSQGTKQAITDVLKWIDTPNAKDEFEYVMEKLF